MPLNPPIPADELNRIIDLAEFDLDYSDLNAHFKDLTKLAACVSGTDISLVNLIDSYTQWSVAQHGLPLEQMPREESVCQYTIMEEEQFEVADLSVDERFKDKFYVTGDPHVRFYFGVPLKTKKGHNIGALCVLDAGSKSLSPEKIELLKIIANEIVNRLMALQAIQSLRQRLTEEQEIKKQVAHDIRGPIGGIIGLAEIISEKGNQNQLDEVLEFISLIQKSSTSLLELADEILNSEIKAANKNPKLKDQELNLLVFKDKLEKLYLPQARNKDITLEVGCNPENANLPFSKNKLLQITGNLISNAIKFTPAYGQIKVFLDLIVNEQAKELHISVSDSGVGLANQNIEAILSGTATSTDGTRGEHGYGFGLPLVKFLIDSLNGKMDIHSQLGEGTRFDIRLPMPA